MKTLRKSEGDKVCFVMAGLDPAYHAAARGLVYQETADGFAKCFPANSAHLDQIYDRFAQCAETIVLQAAREVPIPWEATLLHLLALLADQDIAWQLGGSAALAVRGIAVTPGDLDLVTDDAGAHALADLLLPYLVEPLLDSRGWICNWWCRAFMDMRVEWIGGPAPSADDPQALDFGPTAVARRETVTWRGYPIQVPPLDLQLRTCEVRGLEARAALIRAAMP